MNPKVFAESCSVQEDPRSEVPIAVPQVVDFAYMSGILTPRSGRIRSAETTEVDL